ncbi:MAG: DJ-1/PfpI family protein, partial [Myxococcota bacterium]
MSDRVWVVVFDGYADWEPALVMAELRSAGRAVGVVGFDGPGLVVSMGGLSVTPDRGWDGLSPVDGALWVIPGGERWLTDPVAGKRLAAAVAARLASGGPVAALCGATAPLARAGVFAARRHTSNDPHWLAAVAPGYPGAARYDASALATTDGPLITASGTGSVAFAAEILAALGVYTAEKRAVWRLSLIH